MVTKGHRIPSPIYLLAYCLFLAYYLFLISCVTLDKSPNLLKVPVTMINRTKKRLIQILPLGAELLFCHFSVLLFQFISLSALW